VQVPPALLSCLLSFREFMLGDIHSRACICAAPALWGSGTGVWVRDLLHKGGSRPVVGRVGYLRLCPLATWGEWIFTCAGIAHPYRDG